jgi:hypothetical protein
MALDLGPCRAYFGTAGAEADLGKTQGGVKVQFMQGVADLKSDQNGTEPEDQMITGHGCTITVPLADYTLDSLATALGQTKKTLGENAGIKGDSLVGTLKSTLAKSLLLKKYVNGAISSDEDNWMQFPKAAPDGNFEITFDGENQRIINCVFRAFPNDSGVLYYIGDDTAAETGS